MRAPTPEKKETTPLTAPRTTATASDAAPPDAPDHVGDRADDRADHVGGGADDRPTIRNCACQMLPSFWAASQTHGRTVFATDVTTG